MFVWTAVSQRAVSLHVCLAKRSLGVQPEAVLPSKEVAEVEVIRSFRRLRHLLVWWSGTSRVRHPDLLRDRQLRWPRLLFELFQKTCR